MIEAEIRQKLRDWIVNRAKDKPVGMVDDTPLLEQGILSSIDVVELVLFIEQLRGDEVDVEQLEAQSVRDVNSIYSTFFTDA